MKTLLLLPALFFIIISFSTAQKETNKLYSLEKASLYKVSLVCGAATDIGCGSRSKPILKELNKHSEISSSYLNRTGTIIMIVWDDLKTPNHELIKSILDSHGTSIYNDLIGTGKDILNDFDIAFWYSDKEIDQLSLEEGGRIASQLVNQLLEMKIISFEDSKKMFLELKEFIGNDLVNLKDITLLSTTEFYDRWEEKIASVGNKYVKKGGMPEIELCGPSFNSKACCADGKGACCSQNK